MKRSFFPSAVALLAVLVTAGCSLGSSKSGEKPGELGNGGFLFTCDDSVACEKFSNDATKFPSAVSLGAPFTVRYEPKSETRARLTLDNRAPESGITVAPVGSVLMSRGPDGFVGIKAGYATLASRDAAGRVIDYVTVRIAKPDAIVVYEANETVVPSAPARVQSLALDIGDRRTYRAIAQEKNQDLAGALRVEWISSAPDVVQIESATTGSVNVVARKAGSATLTVSGGTFQQLIPVQVSP